jgi:hypothetical protein
LAIRPVAFKPDGSIEIWHDEFNHGGTIPEADIKFAKKLDGTDDERFIILDCPIPGCDSVSVHPAGGGCDPERVQKMFAKKYKQKPIGVKLPHFEKVAIRTWDEAKVSLKRVVEEMDGVGRFKLDDVVED